MRSANSCSSTKAWSTLILKSSLGRERERERETERKSERETEREIEREI